MLRRLAVLIPLLLAGAAATLGAELPNAAANAPAGALPAAANPTAEAVVFYCLAAVVAGSALGCVITQNIVRMAMCLLGTLGGVALLYFLIGATFLGAIQLIVYAGGTLIVIVFGVMLTSRVYGARLHPRRGETALAAVVCVALLGGLTTLLVTAKWTGSELSRAHDPSRDRQGAVLQNDAGSGGGATILVAGIERPTPGAAQATSDSKGSPQVAQIGTELLTTYLAPFEIASVLLLAVMIGAAYLAEPQRK